MNHLRLLWALITGRYTAKPRERWVSCEGGIIGSYLHCTRDRIPKGYRIIAEHRSFDAMVDWMTS